MSHIINRTDWKTLLRAGLEEDGARWDWTTLGSVPGTKSVQARVVVKADHCIWAASGLVEALGVLANEFAHLELSAKSKFVDGTEMKKGAVAVELKGSAHALLVLERPFLNLAQYACGIATQTHDLVEQVTRACPKNGPRLAMTRKTLPGYRDLALGAVIAGGGHPHRLGLSGGVLIKENHIASAGGIARAIEGARKAAPHGLKIECEVRNLEELEQALEAGAEGVLLDNFTPALVKSALNKIPKTKGPRVFVEVSGGLDEHNIASYALEGVDVLSCGSITHSVRAADLSLLVDD